MTQSVKRYLKIGENLTAQFAASHPVEYRKLRDERALLIDSMSVSELMSLEKYVSRREFVMHILPAIKGKQETVATIATSIPLNIGVNVQKGKNGTNNKCARAPIAAAAGTVKVKMKV
ncbi:MAG: hypothetical protein K2I75_02040 [Clostridiales bacterium]|nr:hypothetical protein [Clostridiales bacterium]